MSEHYKKLCVQCGTIISQCRCFGPKVVTCTLCDVCKKEPMVKGIKIEFVITDDEVEPHVH